ncbi:guanine nucleotide binding protein, alpha subunit [Mycena rosella]|uniref:Guanine nucleotide binding protein, alpha subunit n=1 Tax=Mycena rosella TaxID=1033263 RepID=A0AAD7G7K6_MYCRO|nr:guanine nucleotide binding protein, alpha subunit [Mycena rosella]
MRCISSSRAKENLLKATAWNDEIDKRIYLDFLRAKDEINILLLDGGGAERSVLKQLMLLHPPGPTDRERIAYREVIFSNITLSMRAVLEAMPALEISLSPQNDACRTAILSLPEMIEADILPRDIADAIRGLWCDPGVKEAIRRRNEFQLSESAAYYFNAIDRIAAVDYLPSDQDILRCRVKAPGVAELSLQVSASLNTKSSTPSGQRSDRKKWLHYFENVKAILFCADLTEYDQMLYEDESVNHIQEALTLFDSICNSRWFVKTNIILFLNIDGLVDKLLWSPLAYYFPDYTGGDNYDAACDYLLHRFVSLNQGAATKQIYAHYMSTTDGQQLKFVLSAMQDILLQLHLREAGLLGPRPLASESSSSRTSLQSWIAALEARYSDVVRRF